MKAYEAIIKAAAHIDEHPALYDFNRTKVPRDCNTPACVLGSIVTVDGSADPVIVVSAREFYERLDELSLGNWREDASVCAAAMRRYAAWYHRPATLYAAYLSFRRSLESSAANACAQQE